ncbi:epoxide hydrolase family protein [Agrobacterium sp. NPDC058088]|uniref:epoxide hydrolase family protein n=1 Tax=Agrobacterium sp. NPDC058088 TaxID=3346335 RepID=UPI0036DBF155
MKHFKIDVSQDKVDDLARRLVATRLPDTIFQPGSDDGVDLSFMQRLLDYWRDQFDWRAQEKRLNALPQFIADVGGFRVHYIIKRGVGPSPAPIILTHGWPGSFVEFETISDCLADPARHGGDPEDAFDVIVPSLPGFGFSSAPDAAGTSSRRIAELWHTLMQELGYREYFAQGGDIGAGVSTWLGALYPHNVLGVHLNYMSAGFRPPLGPGLPPQTEEEAAFFQRVAQFSAKEGAYALLHATKPQTLAFALSDSPLGLAAWISEKFQSWVDHDGDLEAVVPLDTLLTNICIYWFGNSIDASLRLYKENRLNPLVLDSLLPCDVPFSIAHFPKELPIPPRSWIERGLRVERWTELPRGGHFAALEQPKLLAEDIRASFRPWRGRIAGNGSQGRAAPKLV